MIHKGINGMNNFERERHVEKSLKTTQPYISENQYSYLIPRAKGLNLGLKRCIIENWNPFNKVERHGVTDGDTFFLLLREEVPQQNTNQRCKFHTSYNGIVSLFICLDSIKKNRFLLIYDQNWRIPYTLSSFPTYYFSLFLVVFHLSFEVVFFVIKLLWFFRI